MSVHERRGGTTTPSPSNVSVSAASLLDRTLLNLRRRLARIATALVITLIAWPVGSPVFRPGIDQSWGAGLHMAAHEGLEFGRNLVFTYGPFGFVVDARPYFGDTWAIAVVAHVLAGALLTYALLALLQRRLNLLWSTLVATPIVLLLSRLLLVGSPLLPEVFVLVSALWSFDRLARGRDASSWRCVVVAAVGVTVVLLVKLDTGLACLVVLGFTIAGSAVRNRHPRDAVVALLAFGAGIVASLAVVWVVIGQPIGALPDWLTRSADITRGYGSAMNLESGQLWEYTAAWLLIVALAVTIIRTAFARRIDRWLVIGLFAIVSFIAFKQGFVRHDSHVVQFFATFAVLPLAFLSKWGTRTTLLFVLGPFLALLAIGNVGVSALLDPVPRADAMADVIHLARSSTARTAFIENGRAELRSEYQLSDQMLARLRDGSVTIEPWELLVAYAYPEIRLRQLPVFQTYTAYTDSLDRLNAEFLAGGGRPKYILRQPGASVDARVARFESPDASLAALCHYRTVLRDARWQLLEVTPSRCGTPALIGHRAARFGERIDVPRPTDRSIVIARFGGVADSMGDRLRELAYRGQEIYISVDNGPRNRFLQGTQGSSHVLTAPACARADLDGTTAQPFANFEMSDRSEDGDARYDVEFLRVPFSC